MNKKVSIPFYIFGIVLVEMDRMGIECERGETK